MAAENIEEKIAEWQARKLRAERTGQWGMWAIANEKVDQLLEQIRAH